MKSFKRRFAEKRTSCRFSTEITNSIKSIFRRGSSITVSTTASTSAPDFRAETDALAAGAAREKQESFHKSIQHLIQSEEKRAKLVVPPFKFDEICLGPKLGSGEFSTVFEVKSFQLDAEFDESLGGAKSQQRDIMKRCELYRDTGRARYALKHLKLEYLAEHTQEQYIQAASDLACEAELLSHLQHPHIIKLRGVAHSGCAAFSDGPTGYFLVIDRLFDTLDNQIKTWRIENKRNKSRGRRSSGDMTASMSDDELNEMLDIRLLIALQIAAALRYLHSHSIMFRDLKPCNIGFDVRGDVKIFDFGLACVVPDGNPNDDLYQMSGAGSPRYMAPEVLALESYNLKADVYSFSILLWEMLAAKTPYAFVKSKKDLQQYVVVEHGRPEIDSIWPKLIRTTIEDGFDEEIDIRPTMDRVYNNIRDQLEIVRGGMRVSLRDSNINRRRSSASFKRLMAMFEE